MTLLERKKQQTRDGLASAAAEVFIERWNASNRTLDLVELVDQGFEMLAAGIPAGIPQEAVR